jgi:predicted nucleic acid-binding Zn ribbon protein
MKATQVTKPTEVQQHRTCIVCTSTIIRGYYGRWGDSGTCSRKCEKTQEELYNERWRAPIAHI